MSERIIRTLAGALMCALCLVVAACGPKPTLQTTWPVATVEATVAPPADALHYPLTGGVAPSALAVARRPLCVQVANPGTGQGTAGLDSADVVYETADGTAHTQLACLYQSAVPKAIAPVGLAGMPDLWIVPQYGAALFSAGAPANLTASIYRAGLLNFSADTTAASAYKRLGNAYVLSGPRAVGALAAAGSAVATQTARLRFSETMDSTSTPINSVSVPFSEGDVVSWVYDAKHGVYRRSENGRPSMSGAKGGQLAADNVVVIWARYTKLDADIAGAGGFDVTLGGSAQASVFRGGQRLDGKWKADGASPPRFVTNDGAPIKLAVGNTWMEVIPLSSNITMH